MRLTPPIPQVVMVCAGCLLSLTVFALGAPDAAPVEALLPQLPTRPAVEVQLLEDAADDQWNRFSFWEAALVAEGVADESERESLERAFTTKTAYSSQPLPADQTRLTAQALYDALHSQVLVGGYRDEASSLRETLATGAYNCLSATTLYCELCRRHGVAAVPVAANSHVYCRVTVGDRVVNVQTTCSTWEKALAAVPSTAMGDPAEAGPRDISYVALVGKAFYNRGVRLSAASDFSAAILAFAAAVKLDPCDAAGRENLLASVNNRALQLADDGRLEEASQTILAGLQIDPHYPALRSNDLHVHQLWIGQLCDTGDFARACEILAAGYRRRPEAGLFSEGQATVYLQWADSLLSRGAWNEAFEVLGQVRRRVPDPASTLDARESQLIQDHALRLAKLGRASQARLLIQRASARSADKRLLEGDEKLAELAK